MEYIRRLGVVIMAALLVSLGSMSCGHDDDNAAVPEESYAPLADAIYLPIADEAQPAWLQTLIADEPYLKVFRSEKGEGNFLVEAPQKGDGLRIFDRDGVALPTPADEQLPLAVQDGQPWTLTHIYTFPFHIFLMYVNSHIPRMVYSHIIPCWSWGITKTRHTV